MIFKFVTTVIYINFFLYNFYYYLKFNFLLFKYIKLI